MNRKEFQHLSDVRLREAKVLLRAGLYDGAYYLGGYAVECALKACIAKRTNRHEFPDKKRAEASYTHRLKDLLVAAGLENEHSVHLASDKRFSDNWDVVARWSEQKRYTINQTDEACKLLIAIGQRDYGVLTWLKRRW